MNLGLRNDVCFMVMYYVCLAFPPAHCALACCLLLTPFVYAPGNITGLMRECVGTCRKGIWNVSPTGRCAIIARELGSPAWRMRFATSRCGPNMTTRNCGNAHWPLSPELTYDKLRLSRPEPPSRCVRLPHLARAVGCMITPLSSPSTNPVAPESTVAWAWSN